MKKSVLSTGEQSRIASLNELYQLEIKSAAPLRAAAIKIQQLDNEIKLEIEKYLSQLDVEYKENTEQNEILSILTVDNLKLDIIEKSFLNLLNEILKQNNIVKLLTIIPDLCDIIGVPNLVKSIIIISQSNENAVQIFYLAIKYLKTQRWTPEQYRQFIEQLKTTELYLLFSKCEIENLKLQGSEAKNNIKELETTLCSRIIGQKDAIKRACNVIAAKQGESFSTDLKPISFLFVGPTGVGKTQLAKELAEAKYKGSLEALRMELYQEDHRASDLIGPPPGYMGSDTLPRLANFCNKHLSGKKTADGYKILKPCVWVLDEFEKADQRVKEVFLGILDEGTWDLQNSKFADKYCFKDCVFIATSNWLSLDIVKMSREGIPFEEIETKFVKLNEQLQFHQRSFTPELLGRFRITPFLPLSKSEHFQMVNSILDKEIKSMKITLKLKMISFQDNKEEDKIKHLINENFYAKTEGVNIRDLSSKINIGIKGHISSDGFSLENAEIKIRTNEGNSKLIAEVWKHSDILFENVLIKEIELSADLIRGENGISRVSSMSSSSSSSSSSLSSSYSPHFIPPPLPQRGTYTSSSSSSSSSSSLSHASH